MKHIWIYYSLDGAIYFSNPRKAYDDAKGVEEKMPSYSTYLRRLRSDGYIELSLKEEGDDGEFITSIVKQKVL